MKRGIGQFGEEQACLFLQRHAFFIVERNYYTQFGEIDIIAYDNHCEQLVFVEVKTRRQYNAPEYSITAKKLYKMRKSAWKFMFEHNAMTDDYRFDSIAVILNIHAKKVRFRHIKAITR